MKHGAFFCCAEQRVDHIKYWDDELNDKLAQLDDETNALLEQRARLSRSTEGYDDNAHLNRQCLEYRLVQS